MLKAIIFDMDGTIIDSMGIWKKVDTQFLEKRNIDVPENLFSDYTFGNSMQEMAVFFKQKFNLEESENEILDEWNAMVKQFYSKEVQMKAGALALIKMLSKKYKLGLGTSNNRILTEIIIQRFDLDHYFDVVICGDDVRSGKPNPDIFLEASKQMKIKSSEVIVIEDTLFGVQAANNADMRVFSILDEFSRGDIDSLKQISEKYFTNFYAMTKYFETI